MASARSSSISVAGMRVWPNSEMRGGRSAGPARSRSMVAACRCAGTGAPTAAVKARQSGGCQPRSVSRSPPSPSLSRPADQSTSSCGRWAA